MPTIEQAKFSQSRNDLYWSIYDLQDGRISWSGYDDQYWWSNVEPTEQWQTQFGRVTGRSYRLDTSTLEVTISDVAAPPINQAPETPVPTSA